MTKVKFRERYYSTALDGANSSKLMLTRLSSDPALEHVEAIAGLVSDLSDNDFKSAGMNPDARKNFATTGTGLDRIKAFEEAAKSDVPSAAFLLELETYDSLAPIGLVSFNTHESSARSTRDLAKVLGRLGVVSRDTGSRIFSGWVNKRRIPADLDHVILAKKTTETGIKVAEAAKLEELRITRKAIPADIGLLVVESIIDPEQHRFRYDETLSTLRSEKVDYPGDIYRRAT